MKKYDEASVVRTLAKNPNVKIHGNLIGSKVIEVVRGANTVGNGTWGKIDFLVRYCKYVQVFTNFNVADKEVKSKPKRHNAKSAKNEADKEKGVMKAFNKVLKMRK